MKVSSDLLIYAVGVLSVLNIMLLIVVVWYHLRLSRWQGVSKVIGALEELTSVVEKMQDKLEHVDDLLDKLPSRWSVVRYDASPEVSGRQSSTLAVVNDEGDGWVLTSLTFDGCSAVYVKEIRRWKAVEPFVLTTEEEIAIEEASQKR